MWGKKLVASDVNSGKTKISIDLDGIPSRSYFLRIAIDEQTFITKLSIVE